MYRLASQVLARLSCVAVNERCSSLNTGMVTEDGSFCSSTPKLSDPSVTLARDAPSYETRGFRVLRAQPLNACLLTVHLACNHGVPVSSSSPIHSITIQDVPQADCYRPVLRLNKVLEKR